MTSACWIYAKHAAYTNISFKQITVSCASTRYCLDKIIPKAVFHAKPTVMFWERQQNKGPQVYNCNSVWHCLSVMRISYQLPSNILRAVLQFSGRTEIVDALHTLCRSFSLHRVIKSPPQLLNKTQDCCNHKTHCWCCWTRSSRQRVRMSAAERGLMGVSCREQF